jgi:hypothetical protein
MTTQNLARVPLPYGHKSHITSYDGTKLQQFFTKKAVFLPLEQGRLGCYVPQPPRSMLPDVTLLNLGKPAALLDALAYEL